MNRQANTSAREIIVAEAIKETVSDLRLVEVADYIAFIRLERFSTISDLVDTAAELYFQPGTLRLGHGGEAHVSWAEAPRIVIDLELRPPGVTVYFALSMSARHASVEVHYVAFDDPDPDPAENDRFLKAALENARIRKTADLSLR